MRKKEKEIKNFNEIIDVIEKCDVLSVAFFDEDYPYTIPLNFGFNHNLENQELNLYFHGANEGKKIDLINKNNKVAF